MRNLFLVLFLAVNTLVSAQIDTFQIDIVNYLNINGTLQQYGDAYDNMFKVLKERVAKPDTPEAVWTRLKEGKEKSLEELVQSMASVYRKHFTQEDITKMTTFYKTVAAQKMLTNSPTLNEEDTEIINDYFESDVAKKVKSKQKELSADVSKVSEEWSRDLFSKKLEELAKAGYTK